MRRGNTPLWSAAIAIYIPSIPMTLGQGMLVPALPVLSIYGRTEHFQRSTLGDLRMDTRKRW